jgi:T-complex protein 1 subunit gamma
MCNLALDAVMTVALEENGRKEVDVKRYVKVEKIPGGEIEESCVLRGVMLNKDVTHAKMRRYIKNPRVLLLDCALEYKKGENTVTVDITKETDFEVCASSSSSSSPPPPRPPSTFSFPGLWDLSGARRRC